MRIITNKYIVGMLLLVLGFIIIQHYLSVDVRLRPVNVEKQKEIVSQLTKKRLKNVQDKIRKDISDKSGDALQRYCIVKRILQEQYGINDTSGLCRSDKRSGEGGR